MINAYTLLSKSVEIRKSPIDGLGLFAVKPIKRDEVIAIKGGHLIQESVFNKLSAACKDASLQIHDKMYLSPFTDAEIPYVMVYINHSCVPNVGLRGHVETIAMRDVEPGEELTGDYCVAYSHSHFKFDCKCGNKNCRKVITYKDWEKESLQRKYKGYFSAYLVHKIES